ncbi:MAG TPA: putative Ig domain-containing protein, partial [Candidatus Marinimicrobia bacterium]|nr:putative Ig domain-containing protein [Candidatus Neomarinimicrobiota bacterium]
ALVGSGTLLNLKVKYVGSGSTDLTWEKFMFNEGTPTASPVNGHITVGAIDVILPTLAGDVGNSEIFPITVSDLTGKNVLSYEFTITFDKNVVKITGYDAVGTLSEGMSIVANTTVPGQIKVAAAGTAALSGAGTLLKLNIEYIAEGSSDLTFANFMFNEGTPDKKLTNGKVNIGRIDLILPETKGNIGETGLLPIMVEDLTGKDVLAYEFTVTYDKSVVEITGYDAVGTLSEDMSIVANTTVPGQIKVAAAGTTALVGSGTLLNLKVKYVGSGRTDLTWEKFMFNEGTPSANTINGSVSGNLPPVFVKVMPDTTISEGQALSYTYTATDADGNTLTFSLVNPPVGAKINSTSGVFSWTPSYEQSGTYNIVAVVTDGIAKDTSTTAVVVVSDVNRAPVFVKVMPDTTISEGQALSYTYTATDADGNTLTFSLVNPPVGAKINSTSGVFSWTPSKQIGTYQIIISLTDGIVTVNDTASVHLMVVTPEGNLTLNPEFNDGLNNWTGFASAPGAAAITLDDTYKLSGKYSMRVNVTAQGSNIWDIQRMTPLPIETGYTYNISYYAVADKDNAKVRFVLEMADSPYTAYLDTTIYIMTEPQLFEFVLKKNTVNEPTTMLKWQFGQPGSVPVNIWIDAVFATRVKDVAIKDEPSIPDEFILSQNYPNPFNPTTNITFGLPKESNVTIDVYNLMGQKVATLVNERINAGYHTVNWNGRDASGNRVTSGVYIYKITAGDFAKSKKMLLVK